MEQLKLLAQQSKDQLEKMSAEEHGKLHDLQQVIAAKDKTITDITNQVNQLEDKNTELVDNLKFSEESIARLKEGFEVTKEEFEQKMLKAETEVKKLGKSRDRLKSLLDEKEKFLKQVEAEKFGSQVNISIILLRMLVHF